MSEIAGMLVSALGQGFIYAPMALGVFLTFSILKTPDLTVEGSFVFGMTACVVVTIAGHPILGLVAGTLAGAAAGTALQSLVNTVMLPNNQVMDQFRFWQTGNIGGASWTDIRLLAPYFVIGFVVSICMAAPLNTLALGDEAATGLGLNVPLTRAFASLAGVLLCASTTALAGPISFVGLMVPHLFRLVIGPDMKKILPLSAVGGAALLLFADTMGRILGSPGELESGIVTALIGAPVFILIIRKAKVKSL